jgi:hypothetical protein
MKKKKPGKLGIQLAVTLEGSVDDEVLVYNSQLFSQNVRCCNDLVVNNFVKPLKSFSNTISFSTPNRSKHFKAIQQLKL